LNGAAVDGELEIDAVAVANDDDDEEDLAAYD
jgi:hypothetical protein